MRVNKKKFLAALEDVETKASARTRKPRSGRRTVAFQGDPLHDDGAPVVRKEFKPGPLAVYLELQMRRREELLAEVAQVEGKLNEMEVETTNLRDLAGGIWKRYAGA